jgi:hypothetical protein
MLKVFDGLNEKVKNADEHDITDSDIGRIDWILVLGSLATGM